MDTMAMSSYSPSLQDMLSLDSLLESVQTDVTCDAMALGISVDPFNWSALNVRSWLYWQIQKFNLPIDPMVAVDYLAMDGMSLCLLNNVDFKQRVGAQAGDILFAQLEIWKAAASNLSLFKWTPAMSANTVGAVEIKSEPLEPCLSPSSTSSGGQVSDYGSCYGSDQEAERSEQSDEELDCEVSSASSAVGSPRNSPSHIHLWQFLKELLGAPALYGSAIRWLDRRHGVFKIEDSVRVARLWGKRKNRPAMNYDKLSRSIRQYYKKGIMKKTERSQRLVYQFCHPYGL